MKRILTGDRPTGKLHLGHYVGSLQNRVRLQTQYDTLILLADIQALTTHFENPGLIRSSVMEVALDNLSVGLDPQRVTFVLQSQIPAIAELTVFYSMLVSVNTLRHNPTIKTEAKQYGYSDLSYGFLGYPVSQTADITFCNADLVPVGEDQLPHLELSRKIVRRFNDLYGGEALRVPEAMLSDTPRLVGLDGGSKMGKSLGNAIYLSDDRDTVARKVKSTVTDTGRVAATDKGSPEICAISRYHRAFNAGEYENLCDMCRSGTVGCVACKANLTASLEALLEPMRQRRGYYQARPELVRELIHTGSARAGVLGAETLARVKEAMGLIV